MIELYEHFNIPDGVKLDVFSGRLSVFIEFVLTVGDFDFYSQEFYNKCLNILSREVKYGNCYSNRRDLFNYLKSYPFFSTLLLIHEPSCYRFDDSISNRQIAMLAHLYICRGNNDYNAYLEFYKTFIESADSNIIPLTQLLTSTTNEIQIYLQGEGLQVGNLDFRSVLQYFNKPQQHVKSSRRGVLSNDIEFSEVIDEFDGIKTSALQLSNYDESDISNFLVIEAIVPLSTAQQKRKYQKHRTGIQRAYYNAELCIFSSIKCGLPSEISDLLSVACPHLKTGALSKIDLFTARKIIILFFYFFGLRNPFDLELYNKSSKKKFNPEEGKYYLEYEFLGNAKATVCWLNIPADFIKTNQPATTNLKIHYHIKNRLLFQLPSPLSNLIHIVLHGINPGKRKRNTLSDSFSITEREYKKWLRICLKNAGLSRKGLTIKAVQFSFLSFCRDSVPEVMLRCLTGQASVQQHYVAFTEIEFSTRVLTAWRKFCYFSNIHMKNQVANSNSKISGERVYEHHGSKLTIRPTVYDALFDGLVRIPSDAGPSTLLNRASLYIHLRIATISAIRPVTEPFPELIDADLVKGILTVADKRVHAKSERRLIVLSSSAKLLLQAWQNAAIAFSRTIAVKPPTHVLMYWRDGWLHLSRSLVNEQLAEITGEPLSAHSLRHSAPRQFICENTHFNQFHLDMLMNHMRAGVSVWSRFAIAAPAQLIDMQKQTIDAYDSKYAEKDRLIDEALRRLTR